MNYLTLLYWKSLKKDRLSDLHTSKDVGHTSKEAESEEVGLCGRPKSRSI